MSRRSGWSVSESEGGLPSRTRATGSSLRYGAPRQRRTHQISSRGSRLKVCSSGPVPSFMGIPSRKLSCSGHTFVHLARMAVLYGTFAWCALVSAQATPSLEYSSTLSLPCEGSRIALPVSVTVGTDGIVCVTDATGNAGHLLDRGNVHLFSTEQAAGLADPLDICVEASGGFVCTDSRPAGGRTIRKLDFFGQLLPFAPEPVTDLWTPEHLLVTRDGDYVTTDPTNGYLAKHDAETGVLLWKRDLKDSPSGELIALGKPGEAPDGRTTAALPWASADPGPVRRRGA